MKIRILYIIDKLQPFTGPGALEGIIDGLSPEKYELSVTYDKHKAFDYTLPEGVTRFPLDFSKRFNPLLILRLRKIIKQNKISIVHGHGTRAELYGGLAVKFAGRASYVSTIDASEEGLDDGGSPSGRPRFFDRLSGSFVDWFIATSEAIREMLTKKRGISPDKVNRIYNGIKLDKYLPCLEARERIRSGLHIDQDTVLIGTFGRLIWQKGFEFLIKSIPVFTRTHPDSRILIAGDGPFKDNLLMHGGMNHVSDYVLYDGSINDSKEFLSAIDILVVPSLVDGLSMITLEGMAMGKPIVATRVQGIEEQITDGETGILVPSWDANAIARAISRIINDKALAESLGRKARGKAEKDFSTEKMLSDTEKVYQALYNARPH